MRVEGKKREDGWENKADRKVAVEKLNLNLETLSNPCLNLAGITKMDLSNNHLELLPESMTARLVNVVVLDLQSNQLRMLPNSIGCLSKLKFLNVSANLIESFPRSIEDCKALEELNANFNKLTKLPDTMGFELLNLQKLCVNSNKLAYLPYSTSHLTSLCFLDAHLNCLRSLPEGLENLIHLQVLNISKNFQFLESIPYSLGLLTSLVELDISYNRITHLPISFGCLTNLCKFKAEGNPLVFPPMEVVEHSVEAMREYLGVRMNGVDDDDVDSDMGCVRKNNNNRKKKNNNNNNNKSKSWVGKQLVKFRGSSCVAGPPPPRVDRVLLSEYRSIDGMSTAPSPSPHHYMGMFSPRRLFSPIRSPFRK